MTQDRRRSSRAILEKDHAVLFEENFDRVAALDPGTVDCRRGEAGSFRRPRCGSGEEKHGPEASNEPFHAILLSPTFLPDCLADMRPHELPPKTQAKIFIDRSSLDAEVMIARSREGYNPALTSPRWNQAT